MTQSRIVLIDRHPGRSSQTIGLAKELGTDPDLIHEPSVGVVGTKGDSQCYIGVLDKVEAIHEQLKARIGKGAGQLKLVLQRMKEKVRLVAVTLSPSTAASNLGFINANHSGGT